MEMTPEQKEKFKALRRSTAGHMVRTIAGHMLLLVASSVLVSTLNVVYVNNNPTFLFIASFMNGFFIYGSFSRSMKKEHDRIKEEMKKILES